MQKFSTDRNLKYKIAQMKAYLLNNIGFLATILCFIGSIAYSDNQSDNQLVATKSKQFIKEHIVDITQLEHDPQLILFKKITAMTRYQNSNVNLNPLAAVSKLLASKPALKDSSTLQKNASEVTSAYIGKRTIKTQIPISIFSHTSFYHPEIQNKLFTDVNFSACNSDKCKAEQSTLLGKAQYEVIYKFLNEADLLNLAIPTELLSTQELNNIRYTLLQYAFNWNDFFSSGLNLSLIEEDQNHNVQITAFQIFLLTPHFLSDAIYKTNISNTLDSQTRSFINYLSQLTFASDKASISELPPVILENQYEK
jgi:hypothetical protein